MPFRQEVWFGCIPLSATQGLADFVIETNLKNKQKRRPKAPFKLSDISLLQGRQYRVVAAAEVIVQANLDGVDVEAMVEA